MTSLLCRRSSSSIIHRFPLLTSSSSSSLHTKAVKLTQIKEIIVTGSNDNDNIQLYHQIFNANEPIILRNLCTLLWKDRAMVKWSSPVKLKDVLMNEKHVKENDVYIRVEYDGDYMNKNMQLLQIELLSLLDYFNHDGDDRKHVYLAQTAIKEIPGLVDDVLPHPAIVANTGKGTLYQNNIWFGGTYGTYSPLHCDPFHNILCQVHGSKHFILYDYRHTSSDHLYMNSYHSKQKNTSTIDFNSYMQYDKATDSIELNSSIYDTYPLLSSATASGMIGTVRAGDALYIPYKCYHSAKTFNTSFSTNFFWL